MAPLSFEGEEFIKQTFEHLKNTRLISCTFKHCQFNLSVLDGSRMQEVLFFGCKFSGVNFSTCEKLFFSPKFQECQLLYCNFSDLNLKNSSFQGCKLQECHFTDTNLSYVDFKESDLSGTLFHNCNFSHADLSKAVHYQINPLTNRLKGAKFSLPEAMMLLTPFEIVID